MKPQTAILLRVIGPVIEIVCAVAWIKTRGQDYRVAGVRLETFLMTGFGLGLGMVVAGLVMARRPGSKSKRSVPPLNFNPPARDHSS